MAVPDPTKLLDGLTKLVEAGSKNALALTALVPVESQY
jgi:hypothetical protein